MTYDFDLLIIGGGIVGAGVARDGASRGLRVLLVEQHDFASGTSSRSSRLLHGGLRYLARGDFRLVWEASHEKMRLHQIAPHLAAPLSFLFPVWRQQGWAKWKLSLGVRVYDWLCGGQNLGPSASLSRDEVRTLLPGLNPVGLIGGTRHFDGLTQDARLVLDTLLTSQQQGAMVRNYVRFLSAARDGAYWNVRLRDELRDHEERIRVGGIVNAAGAWGDRFAQSRQKLRLTKGVHLVLRRSRFGVEEAVVLTEGKRILFVIPWGERTILGTTDTDFVGDPGSVQATEADGQYILDVVNGAFPHGRLELHDVVATWAGVRPLIAPEGGGVGTPSDTSRDHSILHIGDGWFDVGGGKLTTYRLMAEQVVDQVVNYLRKTGDSGALAKRVGRSRTATSPLVVGRFSGLIPPDVAPAVIEVACQQEWAKHLDDVMIRRTSWHYYRDDAKQIAPLVAKWMGSELGWSPSEQAAELESYLNSPVFAT